MSLGGAGGGTAGRGEDELPPSHPVLREARAGSSGFGGSASLSGAVLASAFSSRLTLAKLVTDMRLFGDFGELVDAGCSVCAAD